METPNGAPDFGGGGGATHPKHPDLHDPGQWYIVVQVGTLTLTYNDKYAHTAFVIFLLVF
jgi:hypothetical protein